MCWIKLPTTKEPFLPRAAGPACFMNSELVPENGGTGRTRRRKAEKKERQGVERRGDDGRREEVQWRK